MEVQWNQHLCSMPTAQFETLLSKHFIFILRQVPMVVYLLNPLIELLLSRKPS